MPPVPPIIDPADGLIADDVGPWLIEKHERLRKYIDASRGARAKFLPPQNPGGAAYIDLYCASGRSRIRDNGRLVDGSPLVAYKSARDSGARFSEFHLGDTDSEKLKVVEARLKSLGGAPTTWHGRADIVVDNVVSAINPDGLHFAFLDPYDLGALPFSIIQKLSRLKRVDMLIHVSAHDFQRNLDAYTVEGGKLDAFMPGWRHAVDPKQSIAPLRAALLQYWLNQIRALGTAPAEGLDLVSGNNNQRLYWLAFVSAHDLAHKLWKAVRDLSGQQSLEL